MTKPALVDIVLNDNAHLMSRESDVNLFQYDLNTPVAYPDDGNVTLLHAGADSGAAVLTDR